MIFAIIKKYTILKFANVIITSVLIVLLIIYKQMKRINAHFVDNNGDLK